MEALQLTYKKITFGGLKKKQHSGDYFFFNLRNSSKVSDRPRVASQTREVERATKDPPCTTVVHLGVCQGSSHMGDSAQKIQSLYVCTCMYTRVRAWFERVWLLGGIVDSGFVFRGI